MGRNQSGCQVTSKTVIIGALLTSVLLNECLIYVIQSLRWPEINGLRNYDEEQVVLLVSDPQLQGYQFEPVNPIGSFARWDVDRYLTRTFGLVYNHVKPDIILYLGDLLDEGSTAPADEYEYAYQRFQDVFAIAKYTKKIFIPGDNDVGGESRDFRTQKKVHRFESHFENVTGVITFGFIDYIKLDMQFPEPRHLEKMMLAKSFSDRMGGRIQVILSHNTILPRDKPFVISILQQVRPHLILSGHWHKSTVFLCNDCMKDDDSSWSVKQRNIVDMKGWMVNNLTANPFAITEIMVPTCSYRMGEKNIGYGVAIIRKNGELVYTVLWTPERYKMLFGYIIVLFFSALLFITSRLGKRR